MARALLLTIALLAVQQTTAINVLVIVSMPIRSHYMALQTFFRELALRGHNVTVMNNFADEQPTPGLEFIDLDAYQPGTGTVHTLEYYESLSSWYVHLFNIYRHFLVSPSSTASDCENLFTHKKVKEHLGRGVKYDVIFVEQFMSDCGLAYAAAMYDAPIIGITSHVLLPKHYPRLGIPYDVTTDPYYFSNAGTQASLWQRVEITVVNYLIRTYMMWSLEKRVSDVFAKHLPDVHLDLEKMSAEKMVMLFAYQHHSITGGRLLPPKLLEIAGVHIRKPKPVPKDIEIFLASAEHGAIYVSFGSILKAHTMSDRKRRQFVEAFHTIPQKVIWKWENDSLPERSDKIFTAKWLPQLDILCHPKVQAFVSHGGMLSMSEAAHCGKPLLTVPFFGDQYSNAAAARESGLGVTLYFQDIDSDNLVEAIKRLTSEKMQLNAKRISRRWHDRPQPIIDSAIYWTEYVARHRSAPPHLPSKLYEDRKWFETSPLDVACTIIALMFTILFLIYAILALVLKSLWRLLAKVLRKKTKSD